VHDTRQDRRGRTAGLKSKKASSEDREGLLLIVRGTSALNDHHWVIFGFAGQTFCLQALVVGAEGIVCLRLSAPAGQELRLADVKQMFLQMQDYA
jgi:hypothetical protein